jgi:peptidoglycan/LPS O-acetylase OafA/YrhL
MESKKQIIPNHRNRSLDGIRGFGCLAVLFGHTHWQGHSILPGAIVALDFFFVLSGFLITGLLLAEHEKTGSIDLVKFWLRRVIRLFPTFYTYFAIGASIYLISGFQPIVGDDPWVTLLSTAFYGSNWAYAYGYEMGIFGVTWSLSLEEQFYFLCPIFFLLSFKYFNRRYTIGFLSVLVIAVIIYRYQLYLCLTDTIGIKLAFRRAFYALDVRADSLAIGCLSAIFYRYYGHRFKFNALIGGGATLIIVLCLFVRDIPLAFKIEKSSWYFEFLMAGGISLFSLLAAICYIHIVQYPSSLVARFFGNKFLVHIGTMSYSIYLWHTTVFGGLYIFLKPLDANIYLWFLKTLICFSTVYLVGFVSFKYVEMPLLKLNNKNRKYAPIPKVKSE